MNWRISASEVSRALLTAISVAIVGLVLSFSNAEGVAAEPTNGSAAAKTPRTFEIQLVGPDGKPVPHAEVSFRNSPAVKREQVKVGEFVQANNYSARIKTDNTGKLVVELPKVSRYFAVDIEVPGYAPYAKLIKKKHYGDCVVARAESRRTVEGRLWLEVETASSPSGRAWMREDLLGRYANRC